MPFTLHLITSVFLLILSSLHAELVKFFHLSNVWGFAVTFCLWKCAQIDGLGLVLQVKRIQNLVEKIDSLRGLRMEPDPPATDPTVVVTTNWETFDNGLGSLSAPPPASDSHQNTDWETFD